MNVWSVFAIILTALILILDALGEILQVGQPRLPITPAKAAMNAAICFGLALVLLLTVLP